MINAVRNPFSIVSHVLSHFSHVRLFVTLWTTASQAPLSMGFSRSERWSGVPCPPPGDPPDTKISCVSQRILYLWAPWEALFWQDGPNAFSQELLSSHNYSCLCAFQLRDKFPAWKGSMEVAVWLKAASPSLRGTWAPPTVLLEVALNPSPAGPEPRPTLLPGAYSRLWGPYFLHSHQRGCQDQTGCILPPCLIGSESWRESWQVEAANATRCMYLKGWLKTDEYVLEI